jgi:NTE family protein
VPVVFAPIVIKAYPGECAYKLPDWIVRARDNRNAPPMLRNYALAVDRYARGEVPYIKLLDGGLVDNFGLSGFTIGRLSSDTPYGPMTKEQAVKLRRVLFLVVDAGRGPSGNWVKTVEGPAGIDLINAASDTAVDASVRASFTAFDRTMSDWQADLIRWRCGLSAGERQKLGARAGWNCRDLKFFIGRVGFDQLEEPRASTLQRVETRLRLPQDQVDALITAGRDAVRVNPAFRNFLDSLGGAPHPRPRIEHPAVASVGATERASTNGKGAD